MKVKRVLLVEDEPSLQEMMDQMIRIVFGEDTVIYMTDSLEGAHALYEEHLRELDVIFLDTNIKENQTTFELAKQISLEFNRPLVAISSNSSDRQSMIENGCSHQCEKHGMMNFLQQWKDEHC